LPVFFKQFYLGCLAHASYLIGSAGEGTVIDPQRDVDQYIDEANASGLTIKYVIETHLHADFVSGHRELSERTGAQIVFGSKAGVSFPHRDVNDGDRLDVGRVELRILETPGHTPEGISILVIDHEVSDRPQKVLTGDTLFIGDVGRPDLAGARGHTAEEMAGALFDSLHTKLLTLADDVEVFPAHGAGSMCGRNISNETSSTIGEQRKFNYALKTKNRDEFIKMMTTDLPEAPAYFSRDAEINRTGAAPLLELPEQVRLSPEEFKTLASEGNFVLDVRPAGPFGAGHVPGSINIALSGQFASWAGSLIPAGAGILLVAEDENGVHEAVTRLARVGIETVRGYLGGGIYAWSQAARRLRPSRRCRWMS
jgi:glyoxylase-like metal-dependent hydrolase (beta-lactamase superfamily II)/rhodanese-related sulfurtransferase